METCGAQKSWVWFAFWMTVIYRINCANRCLGLSIWADGNSSLAGFAFIAVIATETITGITGTARETVLLITPIYRPNMRNKRTRCCLRGCWRQLGQTISNGSF